MRHLTFGGRCIFLQGREKGDRGLDQEDRVDVLKYKPPVLSERVLHVRPCDLRRFHITNKYHRSALRSNFLVEFDKFSVNFFPQCKTLLSLSCVWA